MTGQYLRRGHRCELPDDAGHGDVWLCECGRRWQYRTSAFDLLFGIPTWTRRWWPWPRPPEEAPR